MVESVPLPVFAIARDGPPEPEAPGATLLLAVVSNTAVLFPLPVVMLGLFCSLADWPPVFLFCVFPLVGVGVGVAELAPGVPVGVSVCPGGAFCND